MGVNYYGSSDNTYVWYLAAPTKPLNLAATTTDTSAIISWNPPIFNGVCEDLFYIVKYKASQ